VLIGTEAGVERFPVIAQCLRAGGLSADLALQP
jgi:hypothetical protein